MTHVEVAYYYKFDVLLYALFSILIKYLMPQIILLDLELEKSRYYLLELYMLSNSLGLYLRYIF